MVEIEISKIKPNPDNARKLFKEIEKLAEDIKQNGLINKILVRRVNNHYEIVQGERRFKALKLLRHNKIDCEVRELTKEEAQRISLSENIQREDLTPIELAIELKRKLENTTQQELSKEINKSQTFISQNLSFLELPDFAQIDLECGIITKEDTKQILRLLKYLKKLGYEEEKITFLVDSLIDWSAGYNKNAIELSEKVDCIIFHFIRLENNKNNLPKENIYELLLWLLKKDTEWCKHEWINETTESYCVKCGFLKPKTLGGLEN